MPALNPFLYGKPVPPTRFVGRHDAIRTVFSRLSNGESTAIVGEPHIGKSSLLYYISDAEVRKDWLGEDAPRCFFAELDCHMMPSHCAPAEFWRLALSEIPKTIPDDAAARQWQVVEASEFGSFTLKRYFELLARSGWRIVLIVDEFDVLLTHPNFRTNAEFFGSLRSMAIHTEGLAVITASRMPVATMNRLSQDLNPFGSPFFNNFTEVRLFPLSFEECRMLVETTLARTSSTFAEEDYAFIHSLAGRHPFLVQTVAAGVFDAAVEGKTGATRYERASKLFHDRAAAHFGDFWQHLSPSEQTALILLALGEIKGRVEGSEFDGGELGEMRWYGPELAHLSDAGMVEQADGDGSDGLTLWQRRRWRASSRGFVWWVADNIITGTRDTVGFAPWLDDTQDRGLVTREQAEQLRKLVGAIPVDAIGSPEKMGRLLAASQGDRQLRLRELLTDHFNDDELRTLCFDLEIPYESLSAEGKAGKARELVSYCTRRGRLQELEDKIAKLRPNVR